MKKSSSHNVRVNGNLEDNTLNGDVVASMVHYDKHEFHDMECDILSNCFDWYISHDEKNPYTDKRMMLCAVADILVHRDIDEEAAEYLEKIDSRLIYHLNPRKWTNREIVCAYMNTICDWSDMTMTEHSVYNDEKIYPVSDLYKGLQEYISNTLGRSKRKLMPYSEFVRYLKKHVDVRQNRHMYNTVKLKAMSVCGLPQRVNYDKK